LGSSIWGWFSWLLGADSLTVFLTLRLAILCQTDLREEEIKQSN